MLLRMVEKTFKDSVTPRSGKQLDKKENKKRIGRVEHVVELHIADTGLAFGIAHPLLPALHFTIVGSFVPIHADM